MGELEKDFEPFRGDVARLRALQGEGMARLRALKGRVWPTSSPSGGTWPGFESFRADLDSYVAHRNARSRQVKLKGPTPEEFRSQSLVAQSLFKPSQFYREPRFLSGKRSESSGPAEPVLDWAASVQASLDAHVVVPVDILPQIPLEDIGVGSLPIVVSSDLTIEKKFSALALSRRFTPAEAAAGRSARR